MCNITEMWACCKRKDNVAAAVSIMLYYLLCWYPSRVERGLPRHGYCMGMVRGWPASWPCPPCTMIRIHIPTKLKYLSVTVMTAASTVLGKSVRFLEHVSPGCCACIASIVPVSWSA